MNQISLPPLFYVLRHAHTDWNDQGLLMGCHDIPLNEKGRRRAQEASEILANVKVAQVISSPLMRAQATADIIGKPFKLDDRLKEAAFGEMEGHLKSIQKMKAWRDTEGFEIFKRTVLEGFDGAMEATLFITHGHVIEVLLEHIGLAWEDVSDRSTKGRPLKFERKGLGWMVSFL